MPLRHKDAKKILTSLCLSGLFFVSCSKKEEKIPAQIIPKDKMVHVMVDIHLAEAHSQFNIPFDDPKKAKQGYYKFIFNKYKITSSQLMASWSFYAAHPEIFEKIYEEVITELSKKQAESAKAFIPKMDQQKK
jgi:hypothetical protein